LGLYGCADLSSSRNTGEKGLQVEKPAPAAFRFEDVPIPSGMDLILRESFVYETKATKTGVLVYEGREEMEKLVRFFKKEMPNHQWKLVSSFELNNVMLIFVKEGWCSVIYMTPYFQNEEVKRLEIRVGPIGARIPS
jgi:hypothetical protein